VWGAGGVLELDGGVEDAIVAADHEGEKDEGGEMSDGRVMGEWFVVGLVMIAAIAGMYVVVAVLGTLF
jgi:hypothetical protein